MAELRRILVDVQRLSDVRSTDLNLTLEEKEVHYIKRVLRLELGESIHVVDGRGGIWKGQVHKKNILKLDDSFNAHQIKENRFRPLLGIAISIPKRGFDDVLRMTTEMGVDMICPLFSKRSVVTKESLTKSRRWQTIVSEAVEQSERLWSPDLMEPLDFSQWIKTACSTSLIAIASPRLKDGQGVKSWIGSLDSSIEQIWVLIGPEGGWAESEIHRSREMGFPEVNLGDSILRTSTAAVAAVQEMTSWRRFEFLYNN